MTYLIIGIDPGHTVGVAAINFSGQLVHVTHIEGDRASDGLTGLAGAISIIESWGTPSLIATDVRPAPEMALKLAASFNVPLFVPQRPWREDDKKEAIKQMVTKMARPSTHRPEAFGASIAAPSSLSSGSRASSIVQNAHERDALSAAIAAWRAEQNLLRKADSERLPSQQKERLQHLLLQGYRHDFALQKITMESQPAQSEIISIIEPPSSPRTKTLAASSSQLFSIERQNTELRKRVSFLEHEREGFLHRIRLLENGVAERLLQEKTLRNLQAQITRLQLSLRQTYARLSGQKVKQARRPPHSSKPSHAPAHTHRPGSDFSKDLPSASFSNLHPPSLKGPDERGALEKLVEEYRRGRRD
jgi:hypothetical protein